MKYIFLLLTFLILVFSVQAADTNWSQNIVSPENSNVAIYNQSYTLDNSGSTPWELWILSGVIGAIMFLFTLRPSVTAMSIELDAIISAISLVPIGFCTWASFNVDRITGSGVTSIAVPPDYAPHYVLMTNHTLYSFPVIGILVGILFLISIGNLLRIIAQHKLFSIQSHETQMQQG